jgi:hypothetical protein
VTGLILSLISGLLFFLFFILPFMQEWSLSTEKPLPIGWLVLWLAICIGIPFIFWALLRLMKKYRLLG